MYLPHLDTLLAVIDEGSFEAAAAALGVSPSAVSQRVKSLEHRTGRVLLRRTSPPSATEAGEILVQTARRRQLLDAEAMAQLEGHALSIPVTVAVNADSLGTWFPSIFAAAGANWPTGLRIWIEDEGHSLAMLKRGDCLGVVTTEPKAVTGCASEYLGVQRYRPVGSPGLAQALAEGRYGWADLPAVRFGPKDVMESAILRAHAPGGQPSPQRVVSHVPSFDGINRAVAAGLGWAMIPAATAEEWSADGRLVVLADEVLDVPLYWQHWRIESRVIEQLGDAIHAAAAQGLY